MILELGYIDNAPPPRGPVARHSSLVKASKHHQFIVHFGGGPSKLVAKWTMETTAGNKENESTVALMLGHTNGLNDRQAFDIKDVLKVSEETSFVSSDSTFDISNATHQTLPRDDGQFQE